MKTDINDLTDDQKNRITVLQRAKWKMKDCLEYNVKIFLSPKARAAIKEADYELGLQLERI